MALDIISIDDLNTFKKQLLVDINELFERERKYDFAKKWLRSNEVLRILKLSNSKLQRMRDNGEIPFTKFGGTIFYDRDDIHEIMISNKTRLNH